ncbi:MAG: hypothetical protein R2828_01320 [Saprospiraceae bacterium]
MLHSLAIKDVFFKEIDRYLFISTPEMEEKGGRRTYVAGEKE